MEVEVKILKKYLKAGSGIPAYYGNVYILEYKTKTIFGKEKWVEFPIMFENERQLKDFIESAHIFNFEFNRITREHCLSDTEHYKTYRISGNDCYIHFGKVNVIDGYKVFTQQFYITQFKYDDCSKWEGTYLSSLYKWYQSDMNVGLSDTIEEKHYKIVENG